MKFVLAISFVLSAGFIYSQSQPFGVSIYFEKGEFLVSVGNQLILADAKQLILDSTYNSIFVKGYADNDGTDEFNLELSEKRVESVKLYLNQYGFEIQAKCFGEKEAINKNRNEEEKSINRRVDVIFWTNYDWGTQNKKAQIFTFPANRPIEFTAEEGTLIRIPANALVYENGKAPYGDVQIAITEYYSMTDIIRNKLTTTSGNEILISDGMINIEASRNDRQLKLQEGTTMEIGFAEREQNDGFGIFYGNDDQQQQVINWVPAVDTRNVIKDDYYYSSVKLFESDTIERSRIKLEFNELGQRIRVTETWVEGKGISYDTTIIDKTINKNNIILQSTRLGWINCDMYYTPSTVPQDIFVETQPGIEPEIVLIFADRKAMLQPVKTSAGKYVFSGVPIGERIYIAGIGTGEGKLYFTKQEMVSSGTTVKLNFEEATIQQIDDGLGGFN